MKDPCIKCRKKKNCKNKCYQKKEYIQFVNACHNESRRFAGLSFYR